MMMMISLCMIQHKHSNSTCWTVCASGWFSVGCYASHHSMDGLFVVTHIIENFNQSGRFCDANQMKIHSSFWSATEKWRGATAAAAAAPTVVAKDPKEKFQCNFTTRCDAVVQPLLYYSVLFSFALIVWCRI